MEHVVILHTAGGDVVTSAPKAAPGAFERLMALMAAYAAEGKSFTYKVE